MPVTWVLVLFLQADDLGIVVQLPSVTLVNNRKRSIGFDQKHFDVYLVSGAAPAGGLHRSQPANLYEHFAVSKPEVYTLASYDAVLLFGHWVHQELIEYCGGCTL